jgi:calmodulin
MQRYTPEQLSEFRQAFAIFDRNGDGQITQKELADALTSFDVRPTRRELKEIMTRVDKDRNGTIDFEEFLDMMSQETKDSDVDDAAIRSMFTSFDLNGDGTLSLAELSRVMNNIGFTATLQEMRTMLEMGDKDGDGSIDYEEFKSMLLSLNLG